MVMLPVPEQIKDRQPITIDDNRKAILCLSGRH